MMITDEDQIRSAVLKVLEDPSNGKAVEDLRNGKDKVLGYLLGKVMRELKGRADPVLARKVLCDNVLQKSDE